MIAAAARLDRLRTQIAAAELDALLITNPANRRYASGFSGSNGWLLIEADNEQPTLATDFRYLDQAAQEAPQFAVCKMEGGLEHWWKALAAKLGGKKLGFEAGDVSVAAHRQLVEVNDKLAAAERPELTAAGPVVETVRAVKDDAELPLLQQAARLTDAAFAHVQHTMQPGWTEQQVAWEIEQHARAHGAEGMAFESIVAAGPWGARPHARPRPEPIAANAPIVIDMGARWQGYCADMTRTITLGPPDATFPRLYDIVLAAHETAAQLVEPGMSGQDADALARQVITDAGYGDQFGHGLGHGVGLEIHETPYLGTTSQDTLEAGMVITIEPGVYLPDWGGIRIEDMGLLTEDGFHSFSGTPKLRLLP